MIDFKFTNDSGNVNVTFRTDLVDGGSNFTVMQITGLDALDVTNSHGEKWLSYFKKLAGTQYSIGAFVYFATVHHLNLYEINEAGVATQLVDLGSQSSAAG